MNKKRIIVVATEKEAAEARKRWQAHEIVVTGVGPLNVIRTLKKFNPDKVEILNFGYAGSNFIPIGTLCLIGRAGLHHQTEFASPMLWCAKWHEEAEALDRRLTAADCFTSCDFVTKTKIRSDAVFDMELAIILALGFDTMAIKIVSDNLNEKDYDEYVGN